MSKSVLGALFITLLPLFFSGCFWQNKCGISTHYYDEKKSYYDSQGNYIEECPENNIINYGEEDSEPTYPDGYQEEGYDTYENQQ